MCVYLYIYIYIYIYLYIYIYIIYKQYVKIYRSRFEHTRDERIRKSRALGNKKQFSSSSISKYKLLRKANTLLESLCFPGKEEKVGSCECKNRDIENVHTQKKANLYCKLERKGQSTMVSAHPIRAKFQD